MRKRTLILLAILLLCVSIAFAGSGMKTFKFGPNIYTISEYAPDFLSWPARPIAETLISGPPELCAIDAIVGINSDQSVGVAIIRLIEKDSVYIVAMVVEYRKNKKIDIYEDLMMIQTGKPSFELTKVDKPSNIEAFIAAKAKQHKRTSTGENIRFWKI